MIKAIIQGAIDNRVIVLILTLLLIITGIWSIRTMPVDAIPDLSDVQVIIKTSYKGQAPQVVEDQVTYPLTTGLLAVPGAKTVRGFSFFGDSYVYVIFDDKTDLYWARSRVLEYLSQLTSKLPKDAKPELGPDATGVGWVYLYALTDKTGQHDLSQLKSLQDFFLTYELQSVPGVSEVATLGGMTKQYQVIVDPQKLRALSIPLSLIETAIRQSSHEIGASVIEMAEAEYMVRATGYIKNISDIEQIPLGASEQGIPLLLKDVADVRIGPDMRRGIAELNGEGEVVGGIVVMRSGENALKTINTIKAKLAELKKSLPKGVEIVTVYDRSALIDRAISNLSHKLLEELLFVALICALFLFHVRSSLVAMISLPLGLLAAFIVMRLQGINANIMSLGGMAIAIGAMVDGAIVMIENMHKHIERKGITKANRWQLVAESASEVGPALFYSLLIITISFVPVLLLQGEEGKMFSPLAYTKTYAMAASAVLAITLIPVLMGYFIKGNIRPEAKNPINRWLTENYRPLLQKSLRYPKATLAIAIVITLSGIWPYMHLGSEFMPELDEGDLMYMPSTYPAISIGKAREILQQTDKMIRTLPEVKNVFGKIGRADTATDPAPLTMIETYIQLKARDQWREGLTLDDLKRELNKKVTIPGLTNTFVMPIKTRIDMLSTGMKTPLGIKIAGNDVETIERIGQQIETLLGELPETQSIYAERTAGGRYITLDINRAQAARFNLSVQQVEKILATAIGGSNLSQSVEGLERYPINLRYPKHYRHSPEKLAALPIITANGTQLVLGDVARITLENGPAMIKSENARMNGWVFIEPASGISTYVKKAKKQLDEQLNLPPGYTLTWSGQYKKMAQAKSQLLLLTPIIFLIIALLLFLNFRRMGAVVLLLGTLPVVLSGSLWFLYWMNFNLSIAVGVGMIATLGIAIETGVMMIVYLDQGFSGQERKLSGTVNTTCDVILHTAGLRIRPIMMTATATIIGLAPMLMGNGAGSEILSRLAAPMVGGMLGSILLSLFVIPAVYFLSCQRNHKNS